MKSSEHLRVICLLLSLALMIITLHWFGRNWWCPAGDLSFWSWNVNSQHNSQHLMDWYTPSHISHGLLFALFFRAVLPEKLKSFGFCFAVGLEACWEVLENSNFIIDRYREVTMSFDYRGDSIINSVSDVAWCSLGYVIASKIRMSYTWLLFAFFEIFTLICIRDNLILNIIMLIWPIEAIKHWQMLM